MSEQDLQSVPNLSETSNKVSEVLEDVDLNTHEVEASDENVFDELGLTPLEIVKYLLVFFVLLGGFIYGSVKVFQIFFPSDSTPPRTTVIKPDLNETNLQENSNNQEVEIDNNSGVANVTNRDSIKVFSKSLPLVFEVSENNLVASNLATYVRSYERMKNVYNIDIGSYLDASTSRGDAYFQYVNQYETALIDLKLNINSLNKEIEYFTLAVEKALLEVDSAEKEFFSSVQSLDDSNIDSSLNIFQTY